MWGKPHRVIEVSNFQQITFPPTRPCSIDKPNRAV